MPLDPTLTNPATVKLNDPMEMYGNFLKNSYLQSEIQKANIDARQNSLVNKAWNPQVNPNAFDANGNPNFAGVTNWLGKSGAGSAIPQLEMDRQKAASDQAGAFKNQSEGTKFNAEAIGDTIKNLNTDLNGISLDPNVGGQQYVDHLIKYVKDPLIAQSLQSQGLSQQDAFNQEVGKAKAAIQSGKWTDFLLDQKAGLDQVAKQHFEKMTDVNGHQNIVATPELSLGTPTSAVSPGSDQAHTPRQPVTNITVNAEQKGLDKFDEGLGDIGAKEYGSLRTAAQGANDAVDKARKIKALLDSGAITGAGANMKIDAIAATKALGFNVPDNQLVASQLLQKYLAQNIFTQVGNMRNAGVPINRLTNMDLSLTKEGSPKIEMSADTIRAMMDDTIAGSQESVRRYNSRNRQLQQNPNTGPATRALSLEQLPVPGMPEPHPENIKALLNHQVSPRVFDSIYGAGAAARYSQGGTPTGAVPFPVTGQ